MTNAAQAALNASRQGIPRTGIARYDQLAVESEHFEQFIRGVEARGFRVRASEFVPAHNPAFIRPGNRTFYYNPEHMTVLDMMHELHHFQQFKRAGNLRTGGGALFRYEAEAYQFEHQVGARRGFSQTYMNYLNRQMEWYRFLEQNGGRVPMNVQWNGMTWVAD